MTWVKGKTYPSYPSSIVMAILSCSCHFLSFHFLPFHSHHVWCAFASVVMVARWSVFSIALPLSPSFSLCLPVSFSFSHAAPSGCSLIYCFFSPQLDPLLLLSFPPLFCLCVCLPSFSAASLNPPHPPTYPSPRFYPSCQHAFSLLL